MTATATANTNIAVVKYWGKSEARRNLPAVGSLSLTLAGIGTTTTVSIASEDAFTLGGVREDGARVFSFVDFVCAQAGVTRRPVQVDSINTVPTAAGLASSASAFCALAAAAVKAFGIRCSLGELSALARQGSASAARSVFPEFVELPASHGEEVQASPLLSGWDVRLVVARTSDAKKAVASREGMQHTAETSSYYAAWLEASVLDFACGRAAILARDLTALGSAMEHSTLAMHATTLAARPPFFYWNGATVECLHAVWALRKSGAAEGYFTADAGPHAKVLCRVSDAEKTAQRLREIPGVIDVRVHRPGAGVQW